LKVGLVIISRTPFRLSFAGGGTDLPSYFLEEEGAVLSTALNKFMYVTVNSRFDESIRLSYSKTEIKESVDDIEHPIFKYVLKKYFPQGGLEAISMADIPSGTGLGSSSSFTVGLLNAAKSFQGKVQTASDLATEACEIEIEKLGEPIGKQDQFIAAFGGLQFIRFSPSGEVFVDPIVCTSETKSKLEASCLIFFTGITRDAKSVLTKQNENTGEKRTTLREMAGIAKKLKNILESNVKLESFGSLLHDAWELKKTVASNVSSVKINEWYARGCAAGALGGKILGAGSGGFLMFFCDPSKHAAVKNELSELRAFDVKFESQGSKIIFMG
jgi:D-glycero-alpha-D-manno-heptose-7-phosphate kinase